jgi:hypothetical protein
VSGLPRQRDAGCGASPRHPFAVGILAIAKWVTVTPLFSNPCWRKTT